MTGDVVAVGRVVGQADAVARYAVLTDADGDWTVEHRATPYDRDAVLADLRSGDHPSADWLVGKLTVPWG
jgi:hypothetical protein